MPWPAFVARLSKQCRHTASLPNEVLCDVLAFFNRDELERLEMVGRRFRDLIRRNFAEFPKSRREIEWLKVCFCTPHFSGLTSNRCLFVLNHRDTRDASTIVQMGKIAKFSTFLGRDLMPIPELNVELINRDRNFITLRNRQTNKLHYLARYGKADERAFLELRHVFARTRTFRLSLKVSTRIEVAFLRTLKLALKCAEAMERPRVVDIQFKLQQNAKLFAMINADPELLQLMIGPPVGHESYVRRVFTLNIALCTAAEREELTRFVNALVGHTVDVNVMAYSAN